MDLGTNMKLAGGGSERMEDPKGSHHFNSHSIAQNSDIWTILHMKKSKKFSPCLSSSIPDIVIYWKGAPIFVQLARGQSEDLQLLYLCVCALSLQSCLTLFDSLDCSPPGSSVQDFPGKNARVGCHALLQGIFPTQGSNPWFFCHLH